MMTSLDKRFPIYAKVINLYPRKYRREYAQQILQTTADMLDNAPGLIARTKLWTHLAIDLPVNIVRQQLQVLVGVQFRQTPGYIKRNSLISAVLLLPFFAALAANGLDKLINNHTLYNSWLWRSPTISLWVLYLPEAAFLLAAISYIVFLAKGAGKNRSSFFKRVLNLKYSWPIVIPGLLALGILFVLAFHDSVQCFVQTPTHFVNHVDQTWQCAQNNQSLQGFKRNF